MCFENLQALALLVLHIFQSISSSISLESKSYYFLDRGQVSEELFLTLYCVHNNSTNRICCCFRFFQETSLMIY